MAIPQSTPSYSIPASPVHSTHSARFQSNNNNSSNSNQTTPSNTPSLSAGFSNLLKNARKSTESLRSTRSFGRSRNKKSLEVSYPTESSHDPQTAPPMPSIQHLDKPLPVPKSSPSLPPSPRMNLSFNDNPDASEELNDPSHRNGGDSRDSMEDSVLTHETGGGTSQVQVVSGRRVDLRSIASYQDLEKPSNNGNSNGNEDGLVAGPRSRVHSLEAARPASEMIDPMTNSTTSNSTTSNHGKSNVSSSLQTSAGLNGGGVGGSQTSNSVRAISPSLSNTSRSTRDDSYENSAYSSANESQGLSVGNGNGQGIRHQVSNSSLQASSNAGSVRSTGNSNSNGKMSRRLSFTGAASRSRTSLANLGARMGGGGSSRNGSKVDLDVGNASGGISSEDLNRRQRDGARSITPTKERMQYNSNNGGGRTTPTQSSVRGESFSTNKSLDGTTVAQLYAVFGLPKDPSVWTLAEEDCVAGVHHIEGAVGRFWRPEVLGCSICPSPAEVLGKDEVGTGQDGRPGSSSSKNKKPSSIKSGTGGSGAAGKWEGRGSDGKKPSNPKFIEMADGRGGIEKAETARVLSKALKLSFTREVEIVSGEGNYPPPSSCHTFSFSVPTITTSVAPSPEAGIVPGASSTESGRRSSAVGGVSLYKTNAASAVGEGYGLEPAGRSAPAGMGGTGIASAGTEESSLATFFGVVLTVWSAADERRTRAVKRELGRAAKARVESSRKRRGGANGWSASGDADGNNENEDGNAGAGGDSYSFLPANNVLFMPYAICIVSRYPIYNLLSDWNRVAWHKYSRNIEMHNQLMSTILRHPAPRLGETFMISATTDALAARRAASGGGESEDDVIFKCAFPGAMEWGRGVISIDFTMWPLFKTLSIDNILTICEIALAPSGRILFQSRHPALLGLAVETIKYLVELRGWKGVSNQNCHARDVRIYLEDPGNWIIAINTELRSIAKASGEICVVDLDINFVNCPRPPPGALSTKAAREKRRRKLVSVLGFSTADYGPPREFVDAYPGGRFRPLSQLANKNSRAGLDRLEDPSWWDQGAVIAAFDKVLHEGSKTTFLQKVLTKRASRAAPASQSEVAAILALRRRASTFVDARDGLENKIGRLNKRLAFLMSESDMWRAQFEKIQTLVDRLTREANDLRSKVDKERRESRRLSGALAQRDIEQVQLQIQLKETEQAREAARNEMKRMKAALDTLEYEREAMMDEIRNVVSGSGEQDLETSLGRYDVSSDGGHSRTSSPSTSQFSHTPSHTAELIARARANAEARINQGTGRRSRSGSELRHGAGSSMSHESSSGRERSGKKSPTQSSAQNHFTDEQMNYEIQSRTSVVTDQISKIQAQLENTLSNLEGRRSGTFDRNERRGRRTSTSSVNSNRWERYDASSTGHGGERSASVSTDITSNGYDAVESLSPADSEAPISPLIQGNGNKGSNPPRSKASIGAPPPSSFKPPPSVQPKSSARQRVHSNPWKEAAAAAQSSSPSLRNKSSSSSINFNNNSSSSPQPDHSSAEPSPTHAESTNSPTTAPSQS